MRHIPVPSLKIQRHEKKSKKNNFINFLSQTLGFLNLFEFFANHPKCSRKNNQNQQLHMPNVHQKKPRIQSKQLFDQYPINIKPMY